MRRRCVVAGLAYSVERTADRQPVAMALRGPDGWKVAGRGGVVAVRLTRAEAVRLMLTVALGAASRPNVPVLAA